MQSLAITHCDRSPHCDHNYLMEPLWGESSGLYSESEVDFANAPTPFMSNNFADLNDIESDDLLDIDLNNVDMGFVDNEVEVNNNVNHNVVIDEDIKVDLNVNHFDENFNFVGNIVDIGELATAQPVTANESNRKRKYEPSVYDEESEEEEDEPKAPKGKSRAGRKPSKNNNKCMSRNAIAARENREKKKAYMMEMEKKLMISENQNEKYRNQINGLLQKVSELTTDNNYLRGVLANDSELGNVVKQLASINKIEVIGTQFMATNDSKPSRKSHRIASKGETHTALTGQTSGICLHVHNKKVSLELCGKCSLKHNIKGK